MLARTAGLILTAVAIAGCIGKNTEERAATGGLRGAVVGAVVGGPVGAVVGASSGAATGTAYSRFKERHGHPSERAQEP